MDKEQQELEDAIWAEICAFADKRFDLAPGDVLQLALSINERSK